MFAAGDKSHASQLMAETDTGSFYLPVNARLLNFICMTKHQESAILVIIFIIDEIFYVLNKQRVHDLYDSANQTSKYGILKRTYVLIVFSKSFLTCETQLNLVLHIFKFQFLKIFNWKQMVIGSG